MRRRCPLFTVFAILLSILFSILSLIPAAFRGHRRVLRAGLFGGAGVLFLGVVCLLAAALLVGGLLSDGGLSVNFKTWAADVWSLYARCTGIGAGVLSLFLLAAALTRHPLFRIRAAVAAVASILLLILGGAYGVVAATDGADLLTPLYLWTVGCAALLSGGNVADAALALSDIRKEKSQKKKSRRV